MLETNFKTGLEFFASSAEEFKEHAPKEPYLGAVAVEITRVAHKKEKTTKLDSDYDVWSLFDMSFVNPLLDKLKAAGFFWNTSQVASVSLTKKVGEEALEVKVKALEMTEKDFLQKKNLKNKPLQPYERLANAIIMVAVDDYRIARRVGNFAEKQAIESFFKSNYFSHITNLDGEVLIEKLKKEPIKYEKAYK